MTGQQELGLSVRQKSVNISVNTSLMAYVLIAAVLILIGATSSKTENYF